jgi:hypothetical protein
LSQDRVSFQKVRKPGWLRLKFPQYGSPICGLASISRCHNLFSTPSSSLFPPPSTHILSPLSRLCCPFFLLKREGEKKETCCYRLRQTGNLHGDYGGVASLSPRWSSYGERAYGVIEPNQGLTLELGIWNEAGYYGLEEEVLVTETGAEWFWPPQEVLILIPPE